MTKKKNIYALIMVMVVVSLLGFCVESIFTGFTHGFLSNKNMVLPFLWGYGLAILLLYILFGTPEQPLWFTKQTNFSSKTQKYVYYFIIAFFGVFCFFLLCQRCAGKKSTLFFVYVLTVWGLCDKIRIIYR
jgi:hypothetical protein